MGSKDHACALILLLLDRRRYGFPSPMEDVVGPLGTIPDDAGVLSLEVLLPDAAQQQGYLAWLRDFEAEQVERPKFGESGDTTTELSRVWRVTYDVVVGGGGSAGAAKSGVPGSYGASDTLGMVSHSRMDPKKDDPVGYELGLYSGSVQSLRGAPTVWNESDVQKGIEKDKPTPAAADDTRELRQIGNTYGDAKSDEDRSTILARDPLGIHPESFDLRSLEIKRRQQSDKGGNKYHSSIGDAQDGQERSILPTDANFCPLLFLSVVHPNATFHDLNSALSRLEVVADDHAMRLQQLVRENFPLFVRCAEGINWVSETIGTSDETSDRNNSSVAGKSGAAMMLEDLNGLVEQVHLRAEEAFEPLLGNTREIRRTKNALAILLRVGPILSVPNIMSNHLEAGRVSEAVKAYRRVRLINDGCGVELLRSVREKASEAACEARLSLKKLLSSPRATTQQLLGAIRDMKDLDDVDNLEQQTRGGLSSRALRTNLGVPSNDGEGNPALLCLKAQSQHFAELAAALINNLESLLMRNIVPMRNNKVETDTRTSSAVLPSDVDCENGGGHVHSNGLHYFEDNEKDDGRYLFENKMYGESGSSKSSLISVRVAFCEDADVLVKRWLPRLLRVASIANDIERQGMKELGERGRKAETETDDNVSAVVTGQISGTLERLVNHAGVCSLGFQKFDSEQLKIARDRTAKDLDENNAEGNGKGSDTIFKFADSCRSSLPPGYNSKCTSSLSSLAETIVGSTVVARGFGEFRHFGFSKRSEVNAADLLHATDLEACAELAERLVLCCEKRWCENALNHCSRACKEVAATDGELDISTVFRCIERLDDDLTRAIDCGAEIEEGVVNCISEACAGLEEHSEGGGESSEVSLKIVKECASFLECNFVEELFDIVESSGISRSDGVGEKCRELVSGLEERAWDAFLKKMKEAIGKCLDTQYSSCSSDAFISNGKCVLFPSHLSAALIWLVRSRATLEDVLGERAVRRKFGGKTYMRLLMEEASGRLLDGVLARPSNDQDASMEKRVEAGYLVKVLGNYLDPERKNALNVTSKENDKEGESVAMGIEAIEKLGKIFFLTLQ